MTNLIWIVLFFFLRIINLLHFPIFNDEAIYLHWGLEFTRDKNAWLIPLVLDQRLPGYTMLLGFFQYLPIPSLYLGRMVSVLFATGTFYLILRIKKIYFDNKNNFLFFLFYSFIPIQYFFDRLSLPDSIITFIFVYIFFINLRNIKKPKIKYPILISLTILFGWFIKSTILLIVIPLIFIFIKSIHSDVKNRKVHFSNFLLFISLLTAGFILVMIQPIFRQANLREISTYIGVVSIFFNFNQISQFLLIFFTPWMIFLFLWGMKIFKKEKTFQIFFLFIFCPVFILIFLARSLTVRYLSMIFPLMGLIAFIPFLKLDKLRRIVLWVVIILNIYTSYALLFRPIEYYKSLSILPFVQSDFSQYVSGFSSGYGVYEAYKYLENYSGSERGIVFVRNDSGNPEDAIYIFARFNNNLVILPVEYLNLVRQTTGNGHKYYYISRGPQYAGIENELSKLAVFTKPVGDEFVGVYEVRPQ